MVFLEEKVADFLEIFDASKEKIKASEGCEYLSLHRDHHSEYIFYTLSKWKSQEDLDQYRHSELFKTTWSKTKVLFKEKPSAYSLESMMEV